MLVARGQPHLAMFVIVVPAMIRLFIAPRDDIWTFVLVFIGVGMTAWSFALSEPGGGIGWGVVMALVSATVVAAAEVWRYIRRHRF